MANDPNDFRKPSVHDAAGSATSGGIGRWIAIAVAVLLAVLLLSWLFGLFGDDEVAVAPSDPDAVIVTTD